LRNSHFHSIKGINQSEKKTSLEKHDPKEIHSATWICVRNIATLTAK